MSDTLECESGKGDVSCSWNPDDREWQCKGAGIPFGKGKFKYDDAKGIKDALKDSPEFSTNDLCNDFGGFIGVPLKGSDCSRPFMDGCACQTCAPCKTPRSVLNAILDEIPGKGKGSSCNIVVQEAFNKTSF